MIGMRQEMSSKSTSIKRNLQKIQDKKDAKKKRDYEWYSLRHMLGFAN